MNEAILFWFRRDLRLQNNSALTAAINSGKYVIPVYIHSEHEESPAPGAASRVFLHHLIAGLRQELRESGADLIICNGTYLDTILALRDKFSAVDLHLKAVYTNKIYEPRAQATDLAIQETLKKMGLEFAAFSGALIFEPTALQTASKKPFKVFTPFWKACLSLPLLARAETAPEGKLTYPLELLQVASPPGGSDGLSALGFLPKIGWHQGIMKAWSFSSAEIEALFEGFIENRIANYQSARDYPFIEGSSRLSPYLHFGSISLHKVWRKLDEKRRELIEAGGSKSSLQLSSLEVFRKELGWREFAHHILCNFPETETLPLRPEFNSFPWRSSQDDLKRWQKGETGFPIVDAGMHELWQTGWMHNRVRMIVASFLVKDLLISWQEGAKWFWDTLVDADLANNNLGWQWAGGCGADAAPYFRIFNPVLQGKKFDPEGLYVKRWLPALKELPPSCVHEPWLWRENGSSSTDTFKNYPAPMLEHAIARQRALQAFAAIKKDSAGANDSLDNKDSSQNSKGRKAAKARKAAKTAR